MNSAMITRADFATLVKILQAFIAGERPLDLLVRASDLLLKLTNQHTH